jgi:hypothetical protein
MISPYLRLIPHPACGDLWPSPAARRAVADKGRAAFKSVPFIVDIDDSYHNQPKRVRVAIN